MRRFKSSVEGEWNAYAEMLHLSKEMLRHAKYVKAQFEGKTGEEFDAVAKRQMSGELFPSGLGREVVVLFCAFTFEAYLNHLGEAEHPNWKKIERVSWEDKLNELSELIGYKLILGERPFQTLSELFYRRDRHAHGRSLKFEEVVGHNKDFGYDGARLVGIDWGRLTQGDAARYLADVEDAITRLNAARPAPDPFLFSCGSTAVSTTHLSKQASSGKSTKPTGA